MIVEGIELNDVESSNIMACGYSEEEKKLIIQFGPNSVYSYKDFPPRLWDRLITASSKGSFFRQNIRNRFQFKKIEMKADLEE